jgi:hypothetical protein
MKAADHAREYVGSTIEDGGASHVFRMMVPGGFLYITELEKPRGEDDPAGCGGIPTAVSTTFVPDAGEVK